MEFVEDIPNLIPTWGQTAAIVAVSLTAILAVVFSLLLFIGRIITSRKGDLLTGFDCLVLNLILSNFCVVLLVYPYDVIAYVVFDKLWPFSTSFCYASTVFTAIFPILSCWSVVGLTLHQLFAYVSVILRTVTPSEKHPRLKKCLSLFGPVVLIWIFTLCLYNPVSHTLWEVDVDIYRCGLEGENGLLHDSMWFFWIPFSATCFIAAAIALIYLVTRVSLPSVRTTMNEPAVRWSDITIQQESASHRTPNPDTYSSLNPLYMDYPMQVDNPFAPPSERNEIEANQTTGHGPTSTMSEPQKVEEASPVEGDASPTESRMEHVRVCVFFVATLITFNAPYATVLLLFHISSAMIQPGLIFWDITFCWMTVRPFFESLLLVTVSSTFRRALYAVFSRNK